MHMIQERIGHKGILYATLPYILSETCPRNIYIQEINISWIKMS